MRPKAIPLRLGLLMIHLLLQPDKQGTSFRELSWSSALNAFFCEMVVSLRQS